MRKLTAGFVLALLSAYLALPVRAQESGLTARIFGGPLVDYGSSTGTGATYTARIAVDAPLSDWQMGPRLRTLVELSRLPGATDPSATPDVPAATSFDAFQSIEFSARFVQAISKHLRFAPYLEAGFGSRLNHDPNVPLSRSPRWGCLGLTFSSADAGELSAALCRDQRLADDTVYQWAAEVDGRIDLWKAKDPTGRETGAVVSFVGKAILGLDATTLFPDHPELNGGRTNVLRSGLLVSYGKDQKAP